MVFPVIPDAPDLWMIELLPDEFKWELLYNENT